jgi:hypothetical protein
MVLESHATLQRDDGNSFTLFLQFSEPRGIMPAQVAFRQKNKGRGTSDKNEDHSGAQPEGRRGQNHYRHQPGQLLRGR